MDSKSLLTKRSYLAAIHNHNEIQSTETITKKLHLYEEKHICTMEKNLKPLNTHKNGESLIKGQIKRKEMSPLSIKRALIKPLSKLFTEQAFKKPLPKPKTQKENALEPSKTPQNPPQIILDVPKEDQQQFIQSIFSTMKKNPNFNIEIPNTQYITQNLPNNDIKRMGLSNNGQIQWNNFGNNGQFPKIMPSINKAFTKNMNGMFNRTIHINNRALYIQNKTIKSSIGAFDNIGSQAPYIVNDMKVHNFKDLGSMGISNQPSVIEFPQYYGRSHFPNININLFVISPQSLQ